MVTITNTAKEIANILAVPQETVSGYARALVDAHVTQAHFGSSFRYARPRDVALVLLAVALEPPLNKTATTVEKFGAQVVRGYSGGLTGAR